MKKKVVVIISLLVLVVLVFKKNETDLYIGIASTAQFSSLDFEVKIDDKVVFNDTIYYRPKGYFNVKERLRIGFHKIEISSIRALLTKKKHVFIFFNQHIVIEFYGKIPLLNDKPFFDVWVRFNPFYYE